VPKDFFKAFRKRETKIHNLTPKLCLPLLHHISMLNNIDKYKGKTGDLESGFFNERLTYGARSAT